MTPLAIASAARRILGSLGPNDILFQLCREAASAAGVASAFGCYAGSHQQWAQGLQLCVQGAESRDMNASARSALYAVHRRLAKEQRAVYWRAEEPADRVVLAGLSSTVGGTLQVIYAAPIKGSGSRVAGALVLVSADEALLGIGDELAASLGALCGCASTAFDNAIKFAAAKRDQDRLLSFSKALGEALWEYCVEGGTVWWGGGIQAILGGSGLEIVPTLEWKLERIHADDRQRIETSLEDARRSVAATWSGSYRFQRADGSFASVEEQVYFLRDVGNEVFRVLGRLRDVTELEAAQRREREAQLRRAEERAVLFSVFANAPASICVLRGPDHVFELANPPYRELLGGRDVVGLPVREAVPELGGYGYFELLDRVYSTGQPFFGRELPADIQRADGTRTQHYFNFVYQPIWDARGQCEGIIAFGLDVTEQVEARRRLEELGRERERLIEDLKQAVRARERSEERYRLAVDATELGTWDSNLLTGELVWNERCYQIFGIPPGTELTQDAVWAAIHPEDRARVQQAAADATLPELRALYDIEYRIGSGTQPFSRWVKARGQAIFDSRGRAVRFIGTILDISERKRSEEEARFLADAGALLSRSLDYDETLRSLAQLVVPRLTDVCSIVLLDPSGGPPRRLTLTNAVLRGPEGEGRGRHPSPPGAEFAAARVMRTGEHELYPTVVDGVLEFFSRDAEELALVRALGMRSAMIVPLLARGQSIGAIAFVSTRQGRHYGGAELRLARALAERAAYAVDNARLYDQAQQAVRVRDDFLSIASHELKTPLTPLTLHIQTLQRSTQLPGRSLSSIQLANKLDAIDRQVNRIERLVDNLLDIARITGQRLQIDVEDVDLSQVVREVVARFSEQAKRAGCTFELDLSAQVVGRWDRLRVDQVASNLLSNAIKFGAGKPIQVSVEGGPWARLCVRDHGIGIAPDDQARIFERFERAVSMRHYGGFGLGLWIVRQIIEALGGRITVESELGHGSSFSVELPVERRADAPRNGGERPAPADLEASRPSA